MATDERRNGIPMRELGRTGERVTIIGVGGYHIGLARGETAIRIIRQAIDEGINFLDNACCYHNGESERLMGRALRDGYRDKVFLMTKNHGRDAAGFDRRLEESLTRLQTEQIDLVQFHDINQEEEPAQIWNQGALEAAIRAREAGKIRLIGFTGHFRPHLLKKMLDLHFAWDTVQMPISVLDAHYRSFAREILPMVKERGIGAIGMKSLSMGHLFDEGIKVTAREAIAYSLSQPIDALITGIDSLDVLRQNLEIARTWQPMSEAEQQTLLARVAPVARDGRLERYKVA